MARSLTKRDTAGTLYTRPSAIERAVDNALALNPGALQQRVSVIDRQSPEYLASECLIHLIRDAKRRSDKAVTNMLVQVLLTRCEAILRAKIPDSEMPSAADLREEVLGEFAMLYWRLTGRARTPDELDYFRVPI